VFHRATAPPAPRGHSRRVSLPPASERTRMVRSPAHDVTDQNDSEHSSAQHGPLCRCVPLHTPTCWRSGGCAAGVSRVVMRGSVSGGAELCGGAGDGRRAERSLNHHPAPPPSGVTFPFVMKLVCSRQSGAWGFFGRAKPGSEKMGRRKKSKSRPNHPQHSATHSSRATTSGTLLDCLLPPCCTVTVGPPRHGALQGRRYKRGSPMKQGA
jgi:hypothetical protein